MVEVKLKFPEEEKQIKALQMDPEQRVLRERMDKIESEVRIVKYGYFFLNFLERILRT